ncbi:hypothetical protein RDI58_003879 [Solanum bulbocastanum]|uniref:Uncharacterized protein n=1 Tax=Solanum bulbocastanum TaxID=147425 RepID=A0AAN8U496_SOLBU
MASCDETMLGGCNPYVDDPWPCCGGLYVGENYVDASLDEEVWEEIGAVLYSEKMIANANQIEQQVEENIVGDDYYDQERFVSAKCHQLNDRILAKNITKERDILLDNLQDHMPDLYGQLETSGWMCFVAEPIKSNHNWVSKFYANNTETNFFDAFGSHGTGKTSVFWPHSDQCYNYGLSDADNDVQGKSKVRGPNQFVRHLYDGHMPVMCLSLVGGKSLGPRH